MLQSSITNGITDEARLGSGLAHGRSRRSGLKVDNSWINGEWKVSTELWLFQTSPLWMEWQMKWTPDSTKEKGTQLEYWSV